MREGGGCFNFLTLLLPQRCVSQLDRIASDSASDNGSIPYDNSEALLPPLTRPRGSLFPRPSLSGECPRTGPHMRADIRVRVQVDHVALLPPV